MDDVRTIRATVQDGGKIEVRVPDLSAGQPVEVVIQFRETPRPRRSILDILADRPVSGTFETAADVDAYIRDERDSWGRGSSCLSHCIVRS